MGDGYTQTCHPLLECISKPEVFVTFDMSSEQETLPLTSSNAPFVVFVLTSDRNIHLEFKNIEREVEKSQLQYQLGNGSCRCSHCANSW